MELGQQIGHVVRSGAPRCALGDHGIVRVEELYVREAGSCFHNQRFFSSLDQSKKGVLAEWVSILRR